MARSSILQTGFNAGELSPRLFARLDIDRYQTGVERMENFTALIQGAAVRRSGFRWVSATLDSNVAVLVEFVVGDEASYVLSFTEGKIRFYQNEALLEVGGSEVEVATPYLEGELFDIQVAQNADVMYIVHPNHAPRRLSRTSATTFTLAVVSFFDGPWNPVGVDGAGQSVDTDLSVAATAAGATSTVTASADLFDPSDVGRLLRMRDPAGTSSPLWGYGTITAYTSATSVDVTFARGVTAISNSRFWQFGAFYGEAVGSPNYPSVVTFDDQRLVLGGDPEHPQTLYLSVVNDFENFTPTGSINRADGLGSADGVTTEVVADNSLRLTFSANNVNPVRWAFSLRSLISATGGGLWTVQASSENEPLSPSNAGARRSSDRGGSGVQPRAVENSVVFASKTGRRLFRGVFDLEVDGYLVEDLSALADHLLTSGVKQIAWASDPHNLLWVVTNAGELFGVTIDRNQQSLAWHRYLVGGTDGLVESVAVIPAPVGAVSSGARANIAHDQLWVVTSRTVGGATLRSVEVLEEYFLDDHAIEDAFFVDAGKSYSVSPAQTTFSGLSHLEGEAVAILADGSVVEGKSVSGGEIELDTAAERVHVGLPYTSLLRTLRLEAGDEEGTSQGKLKRIDHATLRLFRTSQGEICSSRDGSEFDRLEYEDVDQLQGDPPHLFSGDLTTAIDCGWSTLGQVDVRQSDPLPMTLLGIVHRVESNPRGSD